MFSKEWKRWGLITLFYINLFAGCVYFVWSCHISKKESESSTSRKVDAVMNVNCPIHSHGGTSTSKNESSRLGNQPSTDLNDGVLTAHYRACQPQLVVTYAEQPSMIHWRFPRLCLIDPPSLTPTAQSWQSRRWTRTRLSAGNSTMAHQKRLGPLSSLTCGSRNGSPAGNAVGTPSTGYNYPPLNFIWRSLRRHTHRTQRII